MRSSHCISLSVVLLSLDAHLAFARDAGWRQSRGRRLGLEARTDVAHRTEESSGEEEDEEEEEEARMGEKK